MRQCLHIALAMSLTGCISTPVTLAPQTPCSTLVGPSLRADVEPVDLPSETATAGDLWTAFDGQTGRLSVANQFRRAQLEIIQSCEARDQAAARRIQAPFWQFWRR